MTDPATWFSYAYCTDIAATREFYGRQVGLIQIWDEPDSVAFRHDRVQLSFDRVDTLARPTGWAFQPGWGHGQLPGAPETQQVPSTSLALEPQAFRGAVVRLRAAGVPALRETPFWVGYWSFVVRDPDGRTVELSDPTTPAVDGSVR